LTLKAAHIASMQPERKINNENERRGKNISVEDCT
jgi:hypothetical protein